MCSHAGLRHGAANDAASCGDSSFPLALGTGLGLLCSTYRRAGPCHPPPIPRALRCGAGPGTAQPAFLQGEVPEPGKRHLWLRCILERAGCPGTFLSQCSGCAAARGWDTEPLSSSWDPLFHPHRSCHVHKLLTGWRHRLGIHGATGGLSKPWPEAHTNLQRLLRPRAAGSDTCNKSLGLLHNPDFPVLEAQLA